MAFQNYVFQLKEQQLKYRISLIFEKRIFPLFPPIITPLESVCIFPVIIDITVLPVNIFSSKLYLFIYFV